MAHVPLRDRCAEPADDLRRASALAEPGDADAPPPGAVEHGASAPPDLRESVCLMIEAAARANDLPLEFFARVIWQESRFQPDAVGPLTRSGQRAQGIAQFMPYTAAERGLLDPFDPVQALPKSAEFLRELRGQFGNLGLAAAAYNAGPQRVRDWMAGSRTLPAETRNYVLAITGIAVDDWARGGSARARAAAAAELHAADGAAQARAQSVRRQARGAGDPDRRQSLGRPAQRRLLARPRARRLCGSRQALRGGAVGARSEPLEHEAAQPRHQHLLSGAGRRRDPRRRRHPVRQHPPRRRRLHGPAQQDELERCPQRSVRYASAACGRLRGRGRCGASHRYQQPVSARTRPCRVRRTSRARPSARAASPPG